MVLNFLSTFRGSIQSFVASLKKEFVRRRTYWTVAEARADMFDYLEVFYKGRRHHEHPGRMSPMEIDEKKLAAWERLRNRGEFQSARRYTPIVGAEVY
jgi:hypothetical protein